VRPVVADEQILVGSAATLTVRFYDQDGDLAEPAGTVTVTVSRGDGTVLVAAGSATTVGATGVRTVTLTAAQNSKLDNLVAVWTNGTTAKRTLVEVVGGYYASVKQIRDNDDVLADTRKYPAAAIIAARQKVEAEFEEFCGCAFVPRYRRARLDGNGRDELLLPDPYLRSMRSVLDYDTDLNAEAFTATELAAIPDSVPGIAKRVDGDAFPEGFANLVVEYEHGMDRPPADLLDAFMMRVRDVVNRTNRGVPDRATTFTSDAGGTYSLLVAGRAGSITGIPDVDVALRRYSMRIPGVA